MKYADSNGEFILVRCFSHSMTLGTKRYTATMIERLAGWDRRLDRCFYIPATELGGGRAHLHLRLKPTRNGQIERVRFAKDYVSI